MILILFTWPYVVLAIFAYVKIRSGITERDRAGLIGATISLIIMSAFLFAFPAIYSKMTGDYTANIGWGILLMRSCVYCPVLIWGGNSLGRLLCRRKVDESPNIEVASQEDLTVLRGEETKNAQKN